MKNLLFLTLAMLVVMGSAERMLWHSGSSESGSSLCKNWNKAKNECVECYEGCTKWENICVKIVKHCEKWDDMGDCIQCQKGYGDANNLSINGTCPVQQINNQTGQGSGNETVDTNCQCHNNDRVCVDCYAGYYLDFDTFCVQLPGNCTAADPYGNCTSCIAGFMVDNGECVKEQCDLSLCSSFNADQTQCTQCPNRSYLQDGCCLQVNGYCSEWNVTTGVCSACYVGYELNKNNNKECIRSSS